MTFSFREPRIRIEVRQHYLAISQAEALQKLRRMREYQQLQRLIGDHVNEVVKSYDDYLQRCLGRGLFHPTNPGLRVNLSERYGAESELDGYREMLQNERQVFLTVRTEISALWREASAGRLSARLQNEQLTPDQYGSDDGDDDMEKAINWAFSPDEKKPDATKAHDMRHAFDHVIQTMDVRNMATADYLHRCLVDQNSIPANRRHHKNTGYCGTGGGRALQDGMEILSQGFPVMPNSGAALWDDLACYLYGAHVRAQAYSDGNKRLSRAMYAVALLKGGRPFVAPRRSLYANLLGPHFILA